MGAGGAVVAGGAASGRAPAAPVIGGCHVFPADNALISASTVSPWP